jgi:plasmid stabilization system protein ParE
MKAVRRPLFLVDVGEAADYLFTEAGEMTALRWRDELKRTLNLIREFPEVGRLRSDLPIKDIRTFQLKDFPNWLVFYRISDGQIEFLRVKHGMMHLPDLFESESPPG